MQSITHHIDGLEVSTSLELDQSVRVIKFLRRNRFFVAPIHSFKIQELRCGQKTYLVSWDGRGHVTLQTLRA